MSTEKTLTEQTRLSEDARSGCGRIVVENRPPPEGRGAALEVQLAVVR